MGRVVVFLFLFTWIGVAWALRRRRRIEAQRVSTGQRLPVGLRNRSTRRTWVLVTSPKGAPGRPIEEKLRELDTMSRIVTFDVTEDRQWARLLKVKATPTLLLTDRDGDVLRRLAGPDSINAYLDTELASAR